MQPAGESRRGLKMLKYLLQRNCTVLFSLHWILIPRIPPAKKTSLAPDLDRRILRVTFLKQGATIGKQSVYSLTDWLTNLELFICNLLSLFFARCFCIPECRVSPHSSLCCQFKNHVVAYPDVKAPYSSSSPRKRSKLFSTKVTFWEKTAKNADGNNSIWRFFPHRFQRLETYLFKTMGF